MLEKSLLVDHDHIPPDP